MWIVRIALDRPYTFVVLALLILIVSPVVIARTPTDIFPAINIPVIAVAWQYSGLNTEELEGRITTSYERVLTTTVDNIQRIESTTVNGQAIIKVYLQPNARLDTANAQQLGFCLFGQGEGWLGQEIGRVVEYVAVNTQPLGLGRLQPAQDRMDERLTRRCR